MKYYIHCVFITFKNIIINYSISKSQNYEQQV